MRPRLLFDRCVISGCKAPRVELGSDFCRFHEDKVNAPLRRKQAAIMPWGVHGRVYAIKAIMPEGPIKIGYSNALDMRFANINSSCPVELELLGYVGGDFWLEGRLHVLLSRDRLKGEWFRPTDAVMEVVNLIIAGDIFALAEWLEPRKMLARSVESGVQSEPGELSPAA